MVKTEGSEMTSLKCGEKQTNKHGKVEFYAHRKYPVKIKVK